MNNGSHVYNGTQYIHTLHYTSDNLVPTKLFWVSPCSHRIFEDTLANDAIREFEDFMASLFALFILQIILRQRRSLCISWRLVLVKTHQRSNSIKSDLCLDFNAPSTPRFNENALNPSWILSKKKKSLHPHGFSLRFFE